MLLRFLYENEQIEREPCAGVADAEEAQNTPGKRKHDGKRERDRLLLALFAYAAPAQ
ncbi:MAG TPA: hypothetical protein VJ838_01305 [Gaiellaceae bacterium]|nr:hypothetical protein [Gaiellaceae bacterium]